MKTIFKVGDKVWDMSISNEVGKVISIDASELRPILVHFNKTNKQYNLDGRMMPHYPKTLSFTPYTFEGFSQVRPKKEPEIGSLCLFAKSKKELSENVGYVSTLIHISSRLGAMYYETKENYIYAHCKQIEIKEV